MNRKPGMTLDAIGLYFQRDQTWWKRAKAWVQYAQRCQALLQLGKPVVDVAVFTGPEIPRRSLLPDRLVDILPGIFGDSIVASEKKRLANVGEPLRELPEGVTNSANMADPENWIDPLHGYAYDSFNPDAMRMMRVRNKHIELPGGASYSVLVMPQKHPLMPDKIPYVEFIGRAARMNVIRANEPFKESSFRAKGLEKDFEAIGAKGIAWTHRSDSAFDIYFLSNQLGFEQTLQVYLRVTGKAPEIWDPVTGEMSKANNWQVEGMRTKLPVQLAPYGSLFIVFRQAASPPANNSGKNWIDLTIIDTLKNNWTVNFDPKYGGPSQPVQFDQLQDWTSNADSGIKYYSGTATYTQQFDFKKTGKRVWLDVGEVANLATIFVNGVDCGVAWTAPYRVEITSALHNGTNDIRIEVTNTWANRLIGDQLLPEEKRITWTTAPFRLKGKPLLKAGLSGPATLKTE
jgi:hypothetical protein